MYTNCLLEFWLNSSGRVMRRKEWICKAGILDDRFCWVWDRLVWSPVFVITEEVEWPGIVAK